MSAYDPRIWEYNSRVAGRDGHASGSPRWQFDYIRFPEPYPACRSRSSQRRMAAASSRRSPNSFARRAHACAHSEPSARSTFFGLTTTVLARSRSVSTGIVVAGGRLPASADVPVALSTRRSESPARMPIPIESSTSRSSALVSAMKLGINDPSRSCMAAGLLAAGMLPKYDHRRSSSRSARSMMPGTTRGSCESRARYESLLPAFEKTTETRRKRADAPAESTPVAAPAAEPRGS